MKFPHCTRDILMTLTLGSPLAIKFLGTRSPREWKASSGSESNEMRHWQTENATSGWVSVWERSPDGFSFSTSVFRDFPGRVPESVRICEFRNNLRILDRAPSLRDSVLLNSWDSLLVTLLSISVETCVMFCSLKLETDVYRDWSFLRCSS